MDLKNANRLFNDGYQLYKEFSQSDLSQDNLDDFVKRAEDIYKKYHTEFAKELILSIVGEIDRMERERRKL